MNSKPSNLKEMKTAPSSVIFSNILGYCSFDEHTETEQNTQTNTEPDQLESNSSEPYTEKQETLNNKTKKQ